MSDAALRFAIEAATLALILVGLVRQVALRHGVLDHPTERSSHATTTPRGGGLGLLIAAVGTSLWQSARTLDWAVLLVLLGTAAVAAVGWIDDRRGLSVRTRLAVHLAAGSLIGIIAASDAESPAMRLLLFGAWTFVSVASVNLVNFMDGINGLVASQVVVFAFSLALLSAGASPTPSLAIAVGAACLGFLPWNFPRARIFLGDVGSGGLGYLVPALALLAHRMYGIDVMQAHLPLLPLFGDATWTIVRRWRSGERLTTAHRSHLYQRLANGGMGHTVVTILYAVAALVGAFAARAAPTAWLSPAAVAYAMAIGIVGWLLHRYAVRSAARSA